MGNSQSAPERRRRAEATPIAQLHPGIQDAATRVVDGVVTITWPYSAVTRSVAFVLAEHDFRLRRNGGQLRVEFRGSAARALADAAVGGGDQVRISLDGARWERVQMPTQLPGGALEWQLQFSSRLLLRLCRAQDQSSDVIDVNDAQEPDPQPGQHVPPGVPQQPDAQLVQDAPPPSDRLGPPPPPEPQPSQEVAADTPRSAIAAPSGPSSSPTKRQAPLEFDAEELASPAFMKRARMSYGSLLDDELGMFSDEKDVKNKAKGKKKRSSLFRMHGTPWRYSSGSPSPAADTSCGHESDSGGESSMDTGEQAKAGLAETLPPRPAMVDGACQTQEEYFSPLHSDVYHSVQPRPSDPAMQPTAASTTRAIQYGSNQDSLQTPSRVLFDRPPGQHATPTRSAEEMDMTFETAVSHPDDFGPAAEAHDSSNGLIGAPSVSGATRSAADFDHGISVPDYPLAALDSNHLAAPAMSIDPSLQFPNEIPASSHMFYSTSSSGDAAWQPEALPAGNAAVSVQGGAQDAIIIADSSPARRQSSRVASSSEGSNESAENLRPSSNGGDDLARNGEEAEMMSQEDVDRGYQDAGDIPGEDYDLRNYDRAKDDDVESEEESEPSSEDVEQQAIDFSEEDDGDDEPEEDASDMRLDHVAGRGDYSLSPSSPGAGSEDGYGVSYPGAEGVDGSGGHYGGNVLFPEYEEDEGEESSEGGSDGPAGRAAQMSAPREPIVIDLLSDSDEEEAGDVGGPAGRAPAAQADVSGPLDGRGASAAAEDAVRSEDGSGALARMEEELVGEGEGEGRDSRNVDGQRDLGREAEDSGRDVQDMEQLQQGPGRETGDSGRDVQDIEERQQRQGPGREADVSGQDLQDIEEEEGPGREANDSRQDGQDIEQQSSSHEANDSGQDLQHIRQQQGPSREASDSGQDLQDIEQQSSPSREANDSGQDLHNIEQQSSPNREANDSGQDLQEIEQQSSPSREADAASSQQSHATSSEAANSGNSVASEEGSRHDRSGSADRQHARPGDEEEARSAGDATRSSPSAMMDVDEAPAKGTRSDSSSSDTRPPAAHPTGVVQDEAVDEPVEAPAEQDVMDVDALESRAPGQESGDGEQVSAEADVSMQDAAQDGVSERPVEEGRTTTAAEATSGFVAAAEGSRGGSASQEETRAAEACEETQAAEVCEETQAAEACKETPDAEACEETQAAEAREETQAAKTCEETQAAEACDEEVQQAPSRDEPRQPEDQACREKEYDAAADAQMMKEHQESQAPGEHDAAVGARPDTAEAGSNSIPDQGTVRGGRQGLEVIIKVKPRRNQAHRRTESKDSIGDESHRDPSVALAQAASPKPLGRGSERKSQSPARLGAASNRSDGADPSLVLARAPASETAHAKRGPPPTTPPPRPARGTRGEASEASPVAASASRSKRRPTTTPETTRELRSSARASSPVEETGQRSPSAEASTASSEDEDASALKRKLQKTLRTSLPDSVPLRSLRSSLNKTVDMVAVATLTPAQPQRPKHGPRGYMLELILTDPSTAPAGVIVAHLFRPHQTSLPAVQAGDVVLLRRVQVVSMQGRAFGARAGEASAWAVFEKGDAEMLAQIKGPPVEVTEGEVEYARGLRRWWAMQDEGAMAKVEKATQKASRAGAKGEGR